MKSLRYVILLMCALSLAGCGSHRKAATVARPSSQSRPAWTPPKAPVTGSTADRNDADVVARLLSGAYEWIGTPYRYGGTDRKGADCSGFLQRLFADVAAVNLPRNSRKQAEYCRPVERGRLQPGDLVFFNGSRIGGEIGHVGLYVGDERMVHASSSRGVTVSSISDKYYTDRYCGSGRVEAITYGGRGTRPGSRRELPSVKPEPVVEVPAAAVRPSAAPSATVEEGDVPPAVVVQSEISALVDSAFAAAARAGDIEPDTVCSSWMD